MRCIKAQELFSTYLEKTIQPPMGVAFEQHLAECAQCKSAYEKFHATAVVLDEIPSIEPPPHLRSAVMARIEEARRTSPNRGKLLHFHWPRVFTLRVPARAFAVGLAMLMATIMLYQFTPLKSVTENLLGAKKHSVPLADDSTVAPMPMPWGAAAVVGAKHAGVGGGLTMGVNVDTSSRESTVYILRLGAQANQAISVRVHLLREDALRDGLDRDDLNNVLYMGEVSPGQQAAVPVVITKCAERRAQVAMVSWSSGEENYQELVFIPWTFGSVVSESNSMTNVAGYDILSAMSAHYGVVIMAPAHQMNRLFTVAVDAAEAGDAVEEMAAQMGLASGRLGSSVYAVK